MTTVNFIKKIIIDAPKNLTWKVLSDFQEADKWIIGIERAELDGDIRTCETSDGHKIVEKISDYSDINKSFSYDQIQTPLPVNSSSGVMQVISNGKGSMVKWEANLDFINIETKNNLVPMINQSFEDTLLSLKSFVESMTVNVQDYFRTIFVKTTPTESYAFLTSRIGDWWTTPEDKADSIGCEPTFRFGEAFWTMKVTNLIENKLVRWKCIVANHIDKNLPADYAKEWEGTELEFIITKHKDGSKISLTHFGLNPSLNCFDICEAGWDHFFVGVLSDVLGRNII